MNRNELESPLSLPTAKLEQCDSEYMKENFNISEMVLLYKCGFEGRLLYFAVLHLPRSESIKIPTLALRLICLLLYLMLYFP